MSLPNFAVFNPFASASSSTSFSFSPPSSSSRGHKRTVDDVDDPADVPAERVWFSSAHQRIPFARPAKTKGTTGPYGVAAEEPDAVHDGRPIIIPPIFRMRPQDDLFVGGSFGAISSSAFHDLKPVSVVPPTSSPIELPDDIDLELEAWYEQEEANERWERLCDETPHHLSQHAPPSRYAFDSFLLPAKAAFAAAPGAVVAPAPISVTPPLPVPAAAPVPAFTPPQRIVVPAEPEGRLWWNDFSDEVGHSDHSPWAANRNERATAYVDGETEWRSDGSPWSATREDRIAYYEAQIPPSAVDKGKGREAAPEVFDTPLSPRIAFDDDKPDAQIKKTAHTSSTASTSGLAGCEKSEMQSIGAGTKLTPPAPGTAGGVVRTKRARATQAINTKPLSGRAKTRKSTDGKGKNEDLGTRKKAKKENVPPPGTGRQAVTIASGHGKMPAIPSSKIYFSDALWKARSAPTTTPSTLRIVAPRDTSSRPRSGSCDVVDALAYMFLRMA
ncbi:hypothetical protein C8R43DRAFT_1119450 [Mycena crocata]|nr:hypothetical protein C8R43DRAFT_1119450 [Mycena crocata]